MARMIELTDLMDGSTTHEPVPVDQVAATLQTWYQGPGVMWEADRHMIHQLQAALLAEDYSAARDIAAELVIRFDVV